tara:strand:- start:3737 stop:4558 length:822 start_codon:yes stop_codon:yes gene_type:complete
MNTGEQNNLWGGYTNTSLQTIGRAAKGYQSIALTGDKTITHTNYSASNEGVVAFIKFTGTLSSAASVTFPSTETVFDIWNAAGQAVTVKTSSGSGVAIPNGTRIRLACDGSDFVNTSSSNIPSATTIAGQVTVSGQVKGLSSGTDSTDALTKAQIEAAIAAASVSGSNLVLNSATDTTPSYLNTKLLVGTGLSKTTNSAGANETLTLASTVTLDGKAKVSSNDSTPGFLNGKLVGGTNITLVESSDGGDERLTVNASVDADIEQAAIAVAMSI